MDDRWKALEPSRHEPPPTVPPIFASTDAPLVDIGGTVHLPGVGASLDDVLAAGRAAWPTVALAEATLAAHLRAHEQRGSAVDPEHAADFYLTCACAHRDPAATRALDDIIRRDLVRAVARVDARPAFVDDALQALRVKLLTGEPPKIATYGGKSPLRRWLGTAAVRTALNLRRGKENDVHDAITSALGAGVARGPELSLLRERHREDFERALRVALEQLTDRERTLVRMNVVERMGVDRLSRVYACGRSTVARWLSAARAKLLDSIREQLRRELALTDSEIESLAGALRSDLDVSIARLLDA